MCYSGPSTIVVVGTSNQATSILVLEQILRSILSLLFKIFFNKVTNAELDEKIQDYGDRIESLEQAIEGLKTNIEDQRKRN